MNISFVVYIFLLSILTSLAQSSFIACNNINGVGLYLDESRVFCNSSTIEVHFHYDVDKRIPYVSALISEYFPDKNDITLKEIELFNHSGLESLVYSSDRLPSNLDLFLFVGYSKGDGYRRARCGLGKYCSHVEVLTTLNPQSLTENIEATTFKEENYKSAKTRNLIAVCVGGFTVIIAIIIIVLSLKIKTNRKRNTSKASDGDYQEKGFGDKSVSNYQNEISKTQKSTTVFLIFADLNEMHRKVILNFANYLQGDLGFIVICELFETSKISEDPVTWMEKSLEISDKVIIVWPSYPKQQNNSFEFSKSDLFSPVLRSIKTNIYHGKDVNKYHFCHFDYFLNENLPEEFKPPKVHNFNLMNDFEDLYYLLINMNKHEPGGERKNEKVVLEKMFLKDVNKYGHYLQSSILEMTEYARNHPDWCSKKVAMEEKDNCITINSNTEPEIAILRNCLKINPPPVLTSNEEEVEPNNREDFYDFNPGGTESIKSILQTKYSSTNCNEKETDQTDEFEEESVKLCLSEQESLSTSDSFAISDLFTNSSNGTCTFARKTMAENSEVLSNIRLLPEENKTFQQQNLASNHVDETPQQPESSNKIAQENDETQSCVAIEEKPVCNDKFYHYNSILNDKFQLPIPYFHFQPESGYTSLQNSPIQETPQVISINRNTKSGRSKQSGKNPELSLAPLDSESDPMHSLMQINMGNVKL